MAWDTAASASMEPYFEPTRLPTGSTAYVDQNGDKASRFRYGAGGSLQDLLTLFAS